MRRRHLTETWLVLGVSLGASAIWSLLRIVDKLTRVEALGSQTTAMNSSVTPDRPWLDLAYQLTGVVVALVPVLLALHLLRRDDPDEPHTMGFDLRRPGQDLLRGALRSPPRSASPASRSTPPPRRSTSTRRSPPPTSTSAWWTIPVLVLAAAQNAVLEEVVMVGYLFRRWGEVGWGTWRIIVTSARHPRQLPPLPGLRRLRRQPRHGAVLRLALHPHQAGHAARRRAHDPRRRRVRRLRAAREPHLSWL